jgi:hypothetical protein
MKLPQKAQDGLFNLYTEVLAAIADTPENENIDVAKCISWLVGDGQRVDVMFQVRESLFIERINHE